MDIFEAIYYRKSVRKYSDEKLPRQKLDKIRGIIDETLSLYSGIDMKTHLIEEGKKVQDIISGLVGSYGKVKAPHYLIVTSEDKEGHLENIGYTLEQVILKLTTLEVATCWIGGNINKDSLVNILDIEKNQQPIIVISFGHTEKKDNYRRSKRGQAKRKDISDLIIDGQMEANWSEIMKAVQLAPSAVNTQPWRFAIEGNKLHAYAIKRNRFLKKIFKPLDHLTEMNNIDVGIALGHIQVAADHLSMDIRFEKIKSAEKSNYRYITTVVVE